MANIRNKEVLFEKLNRAITKLNHEDNRMVFSLDLNENNEVKYGDQKVPYLYSTNSNFNYKINIEFIEDELNNNYDFYLKYKELHFKFLNMKRLSNFDEVNYRENEEERFSWEDPSNNKKYYATNYAFRHLFFNYGTVNELIFDYLIIDSFTYSTVYQIEHLSKTFKSFSEIAKLVHERAKYILKLMETIDFEVEYNKLKNLFKLLRKFNKSKFDQHFIKNYNVEYIIIKFGEAGDYEAMFEKPEIIKYSIRGEIYKIDDNNFIKSRLVIKTKEIFHSSRERIWIDSGDKVFRDIKIIKKSALIDFYKNDYLESIYEKKIYNEDFKLDSSNPTRKEEEKRFKNLLLYLAKNKYSFKRIAKNF